jgi:hypothetical protein
MQGIRRWDTALEQEGEPEEMKMNKPMLKPFVLSKDSSP